MIMSNSSQLDDHTSSGDKVLLGDVEFNSFDPSSMVVELAKIETRYLQVRSEYE
jgi:hypothetical protein